MEQVKQPRQFSFGAFEFNPRTAELRERDQIVALQRQPAEILLALLERPGELITRQELVRRLWPDGTFVDFDRSLNKAVNKLREALRDSAEQPQFIETLPRRGYRFIARASVHSDRHNVFWTHAPATVQPSTTVGKLAVIPVDGGPPVKVLEMNRGVSTLRWSPNGKALQYSLCIFCAGSSEIWEQPLSGGKPSRLTNFNSGRIFDFAWSFDRKSLILIRGDLNGDVVLLSHIR